MSARLNSKRNAQSVVVLLCAASAKLYYSTTSVNQLRWILAPTTALAEIVSGSRFEFESHAGYVSGDRSFVIAASCAGVNFLITSFLMLALGRLWRDRRRDTAWGFIPCAALYAYLATVVANAIRISAALSLHRMPLDAGWLSRDQLHRLEGILIYFGFLLLLFTVSERTGSESASGSGHASDMFRRLVRPLLFYYAVTLGIPMAGGAYLRGADFWEHAGFVLLTPLLLIIPLATFRYYRARRIKRFLGAVSADAGSGI
jgi:exosortase K